MRKPIHLSKNKQRYYIYLVSCVQQQPLVLEIIQNKITLSAFWLQITI